MAMADVREGFVMQGLLQRGRARTGPRGGTMDLEYAYQLQMEYAMAASAGLEYGEWRAGRGREGGGVGQAGDGDVVGGGGQGVGAVNKEMGGERVEGEEEGRRRRVEEQQRAHDLGFARVIAGVSDDMWEDVGDTIEEEEEEEEEGVNLDREQEFEIEVRGVKTQEGHVGIGCLLMDPTGKVVWQQSKYLGEGLSWHAGEYTGLLEALVVAERLGLCHLCVRVSSSIVRNQVNGFWKPKLSNQWRLMTQVREALQKFSSCQIVPGSKAVSAGSVNQLAQDAIASHFAGDTSTSNDEASTSGTACSDLQKDMSTGASNSAGPSNWRRAILENCLICFDDKSSMEMATVEGCLHKFCVACMKRHAEVQVQASQVPVRCPQAGCPKTLDGEECRQYLTQELFNTLSKRLLEASVPEGDRVYCPFANCSALMDKRGLDLLLVQVSASSGNNTTTTHKVECIECRQSFCVDCRVPWHWNRSCQEYQELPPEVRDAEDSNLYKLAQNENWQRCKKCRRMIELAEGCYHMTCRCGYEFCYTCGTEWKNKKQSCSCKLWDERNIVRTPLNSDDESDDDGDMFDLYEDDDEDLDEEMVDDFFAYDGDDFDEFDDFFLDDDSTTMCLEDLVHELSGLEGAILERPPPPPPYMNRFYKTKLCRYYLRAGGCTAGILCNFAHGEHELRHV